MVLDKIMKLLLQDDTFNLFFTPTQHSPSANKHLTMSLGDIYLNISHYSDINLLEQDILRVLAIAMTEYGDNQNTSKLEEVHGTGQNKVNKPVTEPQLNQEVPAKRMSELEEAHATDQNKVNEPEITTKRMSELKEVHATDSPNENNPASIRPNPRKNFLNSIHYTEAVRLHKLATLLFSQARELNFCFTPDYTEKIVGNYLDCWNRWNRKVGIDKMFL